MKSILKYAAHGYHKDLLSPEEYFVKSIYDVNYVPDKKVDFTEFLEKNP